MAFAHAPLTEPEIGPDAWRVVRDEAPAAAKTMVARGLAPLRPRDLLVALYQLWVTPESEHGEQAARTIESLPLPILGGALGDRGLPAGVLDLIARKHPRNVEVLERIVRHPEVSDDTLAGISRLCPESICDLISDNQTRWLAAPRIVEALYQNPQCRMSIAQRMVELALREGVRLELPNIDELKAAIGAGQTAADVEDEAFKRAAARVLEGHDAFVDHIKEAPPQAEVDAAEAPETTSEGELAELEALLQADDVEAEDEREDEPEQPQREVRPGADRITLISKLKPLEKIRMALLGNAFERAILIRDSNKAVCLSAIKSPRVKEAEVVAFAANRSLSYEVISYIARRRDWTKQYAIKLNLVTNPKTPMSSAIGFLGHLHQHDVRKIAHSKNIPSALATAAKRRVDQRR